MKRIVKAIQHFRNGRKHGYPLCCTTHYSIGYAILGSHQPARRRGIIDLGERRHYVPCFWCRRRHPMWRPFKIANPASYMTIEQLREGFSRTPSPFEQLFLRVEDGPLEPIPENGINWDEIARRHPRRSLKIQQIDRSHNDESRPVSGRRLPSDETTSASGDD